MSIFISLLKKLKKISIRSEGRKIKSCSILNNEQNVFNTQIVNKINKLTINTTDSKKSVEEIFLGNYLSSNFQTNMHINTLQVDVDSAWYSNNFFQGLGLSTQMQHAFGINIKIKKKKESSVEDFNVLYIKRLLNLFHEFKNYEDVPDKLFSDIQTELNFSVDDSQKFKDQVNLAFSIKNDLILLKDEDAINVNTFKHICDDLKINIIENSIPNVFEDVSNKPAGLLLTSLNTFQNNMCDVLIFNDRLGDPLIEPLCDEKLVHSLCYLDKLKPDEIDQVTYEKVLLRSVNAINKTFIDWMASKEFIAKTGSLIIKEYSSRPLNIDIGSSFLYEELFLRVNSLNKSYMLFCKAREDFVKIVIAWNNVAIYTEKAYKNSLNVEASTIIIIENDLDFNLYSIVNTDNISTFLVNSCDSSLKFQQIIEPVVTSQGILMDLVKSVFY